MVLLYKFEYYNYIKEISDLNYIQCKIVKLSRKHNLKIQMKQIAGMARTK